MKLHKKKRIAANLMGVGKNKVNKANPIKVYNATFNQNFLLVMLSSNLKNLRYRLGPLCLSSCVKSLINRFPHFDPRF